MSFLSRIRYTRLTDEHMLIPKDGFHDLMQHTVQAVEYSVICLVYTSVKLPGVEENILSSNLHNLSIECTI